MGADIWQTLLYGGTAGVLATGLGGLFGYLLKNPHKKLIASLMNFSGGLMVAVVCFDLLPEGYSIAGITPTLVGVCAGVFLMSAVQRLMERGQENQSMARTGILISIGIALHNLPEGLAIGAGFSRTPALGFSLCLAIALHDVPEGLSMAVPLRSAKMPPSRVLAYTLIAGLPTTAGTLLGYAVGNAGNIGGASTEQVSALLVSACMGIAAGAMLYVVTGEMLPSAFDLDRGHLPAFMWVMGLLVGSVTSLLL